ncbi:hypothetical protein EK21DRAFT_87368 [Setomelanomma holmii]|uniref:Uncharacterized protein n=1 Tax=Setomelanomma holmii TaxID=210430 RepID=A0A9P4HCQ2_9PLEO|nr:hypothetical protein EK21DRAFT_87368 [Setomelanomma holmii]
MKGLDGDTVRGLWSNSDSIVVNGSTAAQRSGHVLLPQNWKPLWDMTDDRKFGLGLGLSIESMGFELELWGMGIVLVRPSHPGRSIGGGVVVGVVGPGEGVLGGVFVVIFLSGGKVVASVERNLAKQSDSGSEEWLDCVGGGGSGGRLSELWVTMPILLCQIVAVLEFSTNEEVQVKIENEKGVKTWVKFQDVCEPLLERVKPAVLKIPTLPMLRNYF